MGFNKETTLRCYWSKREKDFMINYPKKSHGWNMYGLLASNAFEEFKDTLEKQGYDISTLKISCKLLDKEDDTK